ncbi:putative secondary metabolism biosynthetic enzyme [Pestalotiopsis sp. IQ-011]
MVTKIPDTMTFEEAASLLCPGVTAYYSLVELGRFRKGERILIHSAAGATGLLAVQIARTIGAEIFATVGKQEKKQFLIDAFTIPEDHIFDSRNTSFEDGVMRMTNQKGVNMVLNSLAGDSLRASFRCISPFGRFIEIGKADILADAALPMRQLAGNIGFMAVDIQHLGMWDLDLGRRMIEELMGMVSNGLITHPKPLNVYAVSEVGAAFRTLQSGISMGRVVISIDPKEHVRKSIITRSAWRFDEPASYVVAGGLGGLGRAIIQWMVDKGAKYLLVPSRSGGVHSDAAKKVLQELEDRGVHIETPKCDISSPTSLAEDAIFENMSLDQWELTIKSKAFSSWNLHKFLPTAMDFFIQLSSTSGIYGNPGQSNYAAGCTFQDALAKYRNERGEKAISIDLGWMRSIGIIAETQEYQHQRQIAADFGQIESAELMAILDIFCNPECPPPAIGDNQVCVGLITPADMAARGLPVPPSQLQQPLFDKFSELATDKSGESAGDASAENLVALFESARATMSDEAQAEIVANALSVKLARTLSMQVEDIE